MPMRGISHFCIEKVLCNSAEKLRRGTLLCFTKFMISKNFMDKRGGGGWRRVSRERVSWFPVKKFCLTVPKVFVEEPSVPCVTKFPVAENFFDKRGERSIKLFRRKVFASQCLKFS